MLRVFALAAVGWAAVLAITPSAAQNSAPVFGYRVVRTFPHDSDAFTQGLEFRDGMFFEGTGLNGRSSLRKVDPATGKVVARVPLPQRFFGEGITVMDGRVYQLTWQSQEGFIYSKANLTLEQTFTYAGEGWGLTNDGKHIFMSDGSAEIRVWDPGSLKEIRRISVHDGKEPVQNLNELEWVKGEIYANVWQTDRIARISPADGRVNSWIDLSGILADSAPHDVLNGIAYDPAGGRLFVTGKLWPKIFEIVVTQRRLAPKWQR